jgi:hypothetical protein
VNSKTKIEYGDFQTPLHLASQICTLLSQRGIVPDVVIEPTCGIGAFLVASAKSFSKAQLYGWDINDDHVQKARDALHAAGAGERSVVAKMDFFKHDWETELSKLQGKLLVLGNLPWVTNATISSLDGANIPDKQNFQGFRGIAALTGKSNFDISEWMLIQLINALRGTPATIAMLCKTATARKLLRYAWLNDGRVAEASLYRIDAKEHFDASVDACLLLIATGSTGLAEAPVFDDLDAPAPAKFVGLAGRDLVSNVRAYRELQRFEGLSPFQWRSGMKHDCSAVMELRRDGENVWRNKLSEPVDLESEFLFPLLKCSDLANGRTRPERLVLVTQTGVGKDTSDICRSAPRTWAYLDSHRKLFEARKSSIYAHRIPFALFGIGEYSFAPWKVAVSGLHKTPRFVLIAPFEDKPVFFDDACYFLPFQNPEEAKVVASILNSEPCLCFISSLLFDDSKRPITVELLQRLNLRAIAKEAGLSDEWESARNQQLVYSGAREGLQAEFIMEQPASAKSIGT